jgi:hypothetical protein
MTFGALFNCAPVPTDCLLFASSLALSFVAAVVLPLAAGLVVAVVVVGGTIVVFGSSFFSTFFSSFFSSFLSVALGASFLAAAYAAAFLSTGTTSVIPPAFILSFKLSSIGSASSLAAGFFFSNPIFFWIAGAGLLILTSFAAGCFFSSVVPFA